MSTFEEITFNNEDAVVKIPEKNARLGTTLLFSPKNAWILSANNIVRDQYGHQSTADWIIHSVSGNGQSLNYTTSSRISNKIKNDNQWKSNINSIIKANSTKKSFSYSNSMALTSGELFTGLNKISYTLNFYKLSNGKWIYSGYIKDRYDFSWLSYKNYYKNFAVTLANNAAYTSQMTNVITPFNILIYIES